MNELLTWLSVRHHRYLTIYLLFALSALILLGHQSSLGWALTQLESASDLTSLASLANTTLLTRIVAVILDYGIAWLRIFAQFRIEELVLILLAALLVQKTPPYPTPTIIRVLLSAEVALTLGLALVLNQAFLSSDTGLAVTLIRNFGWVYGIGSVVIMAGITLEGIRLCFVSYSD